MSENNYRETAKKWASAPFDTDTIQRTQQLLNGDESALEDAFYKNLEFGTGGMRGVMDVGTNRINKYTLGAATQGLANYLKQTFPNKELKVAIGYDCRHNSDTFGKLVADVLTANGIFVYLFEALRPTPELSFTVRHLGCDAGIVLTASHNPPEYNGYKVYWNDGAQIVPPQDKGIIDEVNKVSIEDIQFKGDDSKIEYIGETIDKAFIETALKESVNQEGHEDLVISFTSIHGTSIKTLPQLLKADGFSQVHIVEEQAEPDGNFPTVESPNPEEPAALKMAVELAEEIDADIVLGTDPDADRIGVAVRNLQGEMTLLNGNQTAVALTYFLLKNMSDKGALKSNDFIARTVVTTDLMDKIAAHYKVNCYHSLTGFKWIADVIKQREAKERYIGGGEESFGFMIGDFVRDKDSNTSAMIICEFAAWAKAKGSSLYKEIIKIYEQFGCYEERLISLVKKGKSGAEEIQQMMVDFRRNTPESVVGIKVKEVVDYQSQEKKNMSTGVIAPTQIPQSNVFQFVLDDDTVITARPSGTEPKIKFYISVNAPLEKGADYEKLKSQLNHKIDQIIQELNIG